MILINAVTICKIYNVKQSLYILKFIQIDYVFLNKKRARDDIGVSNIYRS